MAYKYQPAEIQDFSGGMTDQYVNGKITCAEVLENFMVLGNKSVITRPGTELESLVAPQLPSGDSRVQTLLSYANGDKLFYHNATKLFYRNPVAFATLTGPTGNQAFNLATLDSHLAHTEWNRHLVITSDSLNKPVKVYKDGSNNYQLRTAGLPALASSPSVSGTAGAAAYIYAFFHKYTYTVFGQTFIDYGPVTKVQVLNVDSPNVNPISSTLIPTLANATGDNYDTSNIKIVIARTINGGQEFYEVTEVSNGTASYSDTMSDTALQDNASIYTSGGVPNNDPPPISKFCHSVNGKTYYAYVVENGQTLSSTYLQSQALDPDSVPTSFRDEIEDEITGFSSVQDVPIIGCAKHIYRVDGEFDELGRGGMSHRRISDTAGCISHESFVQTDMGLFWFGNDGIYFTKGHDCIKVTNHLNDRYQSYIASLAGKTRKIKGVYNPAEKCIYWTISLTTKAVGAEECDGIWILDLNWGISSEICSHVWSGSSSFYPTAIAIHNKVLYRGDRYGYVLKFSYNFLTDPKIDLITDVDSWYQETIIWTYRSVASNFGTSFVRKMANKVLISCKNIANVSLAMSAINDDGKTTRNFTPIRWRRNFSWGDEEFVWGNPDFSWYYGGTIEIDRRFPAKGLRFNYLQLQFTNDFTNIINSDTYGTATVDGITNTATLNNAPTVSWLSQSVDYYLYLENDNYTRGYKILARTDGTLTLEDANNALVNGSWKWQMKGFRKTEVINLLGYSISWALTSRSHDTFNTGDDGGLS